MVNHYHSEEQNMEYSKIYAKRIYELCEERGWSINKLAELANVKQSTINNIINNGSNNPTVKTLHKIALCFSMTLSEFLDFPELNDYSFDD